MVKYIQLYSMLFHGLLNEFFPAWSGANKVKVSYLLVELLYAKNNAYGGYPAPASDDKIIQFIRDIFYLVGNRIKHYIRMVYNVKTVFHNKVVPFFGIFPCLTVKNVMPPALAGNLNRSPVLKNDIRHWKGIYPFLCRTAVKYRARNTKMPCYCRSYWCLGRMYTATRNNSLMVVFYVFH